jgi:hypothetical protein
MGDRAKTRLVGSALARPLPLAAVLVLVLNDHVLKGAGILPGWLTGKLSDVAGLFFFPVLLATSAAWILSRWAADRWTRHLPLAATALTGVLFTLLKTSPEANAWAGRVWGQIVLDPTDLVALPSLLLAFGYLEKDVAADVRPPSRASRLLSVLFAAAASIATPAPRWTRNFPAWEIHEGAQQTVGCADLAVWVSKSGKEGVGLTVRATSMESCPVVIQGARFVLEADPAVEIATTDPLPVAMTAAARHPAHAYLAFPFDNEDAWNDGRRRGRFELTLRVEERPVVMSLPALHVLRGFHTAAERFTLPPPQLERAAPATSGSAVPLEMGAP